jgi:hypothetical protein
VFAPSALAQATNTGTVVGQVTDPQGAVVPGAKITLRDPSTGNTFNTTTNDQGRYVIVNVPPASYDLTASKSGFSTAKVSAANVEVGLTSTYDVKMAVGEVSTTVEVQATNVELQTMNATVGNTVSTQAINNLPSLGRDVSTFATLQPGVSPDGSVAGAVVDQSTFQLDGGNNTNDMDGSMNVYTPSYAGDATGGITAAMVGAPPTGVMPTPSDSVEEFKVNTANQTADFNSSAGAQVQVVTRRGTNAWHGTAYNYYEDNNLNANTWQNNCTTSCGKSFTPAPDWHRNRFGGSIGGPIIPKNILGGKTYFFGFYQGFRWPNSQTIERPVPSVNMRAGILQFSGSGCSNAGTCTINLNTADPQCAAGGHPGVTCGLNPVVNQLWTKFLPLPNDSSCSTVGVGSRCDTKNTQGFVANMAIPQNDNYGVARLDHDFGAKWHFFGSYRYYRLDRATTDQIDIGGFFPGNTLGSPTSLSNRPQLPWYWVAGLTTNITPTTTNDFHYSMLRNWWQWASNGGPAQLPGLAAALEPLGESTNALIPYNVNTQSVRTRYWDGIDHMFRDDITQLHGNHLFQFGGTYQRNHDKHQRTDNGGGINFWPTYQLGSSTTKLDGVSSLCSPTGNCLTGTSTEARNVAAVLGIVSQTQVAYTRSGPNLALNPPQTPANEDSVIPFYNVYFSDSWHMKPSLTLSYGLGWTLEMPPVDSEGRQVEAVDASNQLLNTQSYLKTRENLALAGIPYDPIVGFSLVGNSENGRKYPYNPFYGAFSPRVAVAWNPDYSFLGGKGTVIRAGYGRVYGRLNGVDLVLVPLLGTGLIQPVQCLSVMAGGCVPGTTPTLANTGPSSTAFRIGVNGLTAPLAAASPTLPQPLFPGLSTCVGLPNNTCVEAGAGEGFDPNFRPNSVDSFDLTIQRQVTSKVTVEVGYLGRIINHEYQPININAVPYMFTVGGQQFQTAYANVERGLGCVQSYATCGTGNPASIANQPFFETALAGTGYCTPNAAGPKSCTQMVISNEMSNFTSQSVWSLWSDLDGGGIGGGPICKNAGGCTNANGTKVATGANTTVPGFNFARTMMNTPLPQTGLGQLSSGLGLNGSIGHGNYNAGFVSLKMASWHGLTAQSNFTWGKSLGTGAFVQATSEYTANDPYHLDNQYGYQDFDRKFVYNMFFVYEPPLYKGQQGIVGRLLGGWTFSPIFTTGSGLPLACGVANGFTNGGQEFGAADATSFFSNIGCIFPNGQPNGTSAHYGVAGDTTTGVGTATAGTSTSTQVNIFSNPLAAYNLAAPPILGITTHVGGTATEGANGILRGMPYWNVDMSVVKDIKATERVGFTFQAVFTNLFNHNQFLDATLDPSTTTTWGVLGTQGSNPRAMEFGFRVHF